METNKKYIVLGGGITGLAAAWYLEKNGARDITLLEAGNRLGGKIKTTREDGFIVESGADSFITTKPFALDLINELGLSDELLEPLTSRFYFLKNGKLIDSPKGIRMMVPTDTAAFLETPLFSAQAKQRILQEGQVSAGNTDGDESLGSFIERRFGREMLENYVEPLFGGIYATPADELSIETSFPMFRALERRHGSLSQAVQQMPKEQEGQGRSSFMSLRSGMQSLPDAIARQLRYTKALLNAQVKHVERQENGQYRITLADGAQLEADAVISTLSPWTLAGLMEGLSEEAAELLKSYSFSSSHIVTLAYLRKDIQHPLRATGYVVPRSEKTPVTASTWSSEKWEHRAPEAFALIRCFFGQEQNQRPEQELVAMAHDTMSRILGIQAMPLHRWVSHYVQALPQYKVGHLKRLQQLREALNSYPGLFIAGAAFEGVGIPDCIKQGKEAAEKALSGS